MSKLMSKLVQKLKVSFFARMIACVVAGLVVSLVLCAILITTGYFSLASSSASSYQVTFFGLPIYEIVKSGKSLVGHAVGANMPLIGMVSASVLSLVTELILALLRAKAMKNNTDISTKD